MHCLRGVRPVRDRQRGRTTPDRAGHPRHRTPTIVRPGVRRETPPPVPPHAPVAPPHVVPPHVVPMMSLLRPSDEEIHYSDGSHRWPCPDPDADADAWTN